MTKIWIEDAALRDKVQRLAAELDLSLAPDGRLVSYQVGPAGKLEVADQGEGVHIVAPDLPHFFHGLALWNMRQQAGQTSSFSQPISFSRNGLMLDNSRNAVAKVDYVKSLLRRLAVLGHTWYMLYMEDVYEIPEQPYFGAFRGRYSQADLRELDAYAQDLGIELVPCVQTLAHLNQFFQWEHINSQYADLADVLHVGREETYTLIDQMLASLSSCFTTKRIHLGMDEAYDLGRGHYLDQVGLRAKTDIMLDHLARMKTLCDRYDLEPIIWDDMFFSWYNQVGEDEKIAIPEGISLMYWDYYQHSTQAYLDKIAQRRSLGAQVSFAGGAWRWTGYTPHHRKTLVASLAGLEAARQTGIQEVMATAWGDDSSESPFEVAVFGLVLYSYLDSHADYVEEEFSQWLSFFSGLSLSDWLKQGELDLLPEWDQLAGIDVTPSKYFFYQDLLLPMFMPQIESMDVDYGARMAKLAVDFDAMEGGNPAVNQFYSDYALCLANKWNLPYLIWQAYHAHDRQTLADLVHGRLPQLIADYDRVLQSRRQVWLQEANPFGLEILEYRIGGLMTRTQAVISRLKDYLSGRVDSLPELEEARLNPLPNDQSGFKPAVNYNRALRTMSRSRMTW